MYLLDSMTTVSGGGMAFPILFLLVAILGIVVFILNLLFLIRVPKYLKGIGFQLMDLNKEMEKANKNLAKMQDGQRVHNEVEEARLKGKCGETDKNQPKSEKASRNLMLPDGYYDRHPEDKK